MQRKTYYHLNEHIYIAQFQEELILLDAKQDKYIICSQKFKELLLSIVEDSHLQVGKDLVLSPDFRDLPQDIGNLQKLVDNGLLQKKDTIYPYYIDLKIKSNGVSNVDWSLPLDQKESPLNNQVLKALIALIKINLYVKIGGFYSAIQLIKKSRKLDSNYIIPKEEELTNLANIINKACFIYPTRTKCLEWAMTFVLLALHRGWKCNLEIGVQNYPFFAHAWVECDEKVVMDSQDLREGLAIIVNEPFRKLKI
ncbi:hypothetical protein Aasi_0900 [Candidatus Amoebophilus asiaticus 5a2]|uniref:Microcin J25-processing protein McjB C-terminal domain-containing protein n=1 Tax=Amoebophilus asiaticus (strain 5a2) TaxID=452471 RepID=B3ESR5_AMOA5|nr:lasso peptide biosynthesis B2 protein [Candidatus Amoebophilus asiaticus]ACE06267.1 hypothetical protein Aasi_0900 [Candidatus Amoebophilus asiaticus 5a2]